MFSYVHFILHKMITFVVDAFHIFLMQFTYMIALSVQSDCRSLYLSSNHVLYT